MVEWRWLGVAGRPASEQRGDGRRRAGRAARVGWVAACAGGARRGGHGRRRRQRRGQRRRRARGTRRRCVRVRERRETKEKKGPDNF
jgi:hypothetical protein